MNTGSRRTQGTLIVVVGVGDCDALGDSEGVGLGDGLADVGVCEGDGDDELADGVGRAFGRASDSNVSAASSIAEKRESVTWP